MDDKRQKSDTDGGFELSSVLQTIPFLLLYTILHFKSISSEI